MKFPQTRLLLAATVMLVMSASIAGCGGDKPPPASPPPNVAVVTVHQGAVPVVTELPGRTSAFLVAQVRARVDGIVQRREFEEGADITADQRLYKIDPAPYRAALDSARAQLTRAQANVGATHAQAARDEVLVAGNAVSKQALLNAVAAERQAVADVAAGQAAVQTAAINLGYTDIVAPITGRIGTSLVTQGAYVQASAATLMATIQQIDPIYVDLNQTSVEGLQLRREIANGRLKMIGKNGPTVHLLLEDGSTYRHSGTLQFTDITVDRGTGSVTVRAIFPNPQHVLLPGMFVRARIDEGTDSTAILVPQEGVTHDRNGNATVLVVGADNKVALQTVAATRTYGTSWVIESGLKEGDRVIVGGTQKVQPGMLVHATATSHTSTPAAPKLARTSPEKPATGDAAGDE
jgi:membrane fusion protein (multidrug efflux system)